MNVTPLDFEKPILELAKKLEDLKRHLRGQDIDSDPEVRRIAAHIDKTKRQVYANLSSWQRVQIARQSSTALCPGLSAAVFLGFYRTARGPRFRRRPGADRGFCDDRRHPLRGSSRTRRVATRKRTSSATSAAPIRKAIARHFG